jgi:catechol 2,3-dioxygenase-like lactoylglutathione lyase family enzyme
MRLDHTIVAAKDKVASAEFFAGIFDRPVAHGYFSQVRVDEALTLDFADEDEMGGGCTHYAFHVTDAEFDAIFARVKARGLAYGSQPDDHANRRINRRRGGRGFYFQDPYGHLLEVMTVPETGS